MNKSVYEDYKYSMQDVSSLYVGTKYTLGELVQEESITFKFRLIVEHYILPKADEEDTLETHLYYLEPDSFLIQIYKQLKARVKVNVLEERRRLLGGTTREYVTKNLTIEQLAAIPPSEKERDGMVVQELKVSKLAMMTL
ncbi:MAG: hypothetical protein NC417_03935 [Candidatus Gastranaerophilales bacterium]|nr:hypothetical protein [Candidatus Gastranaerophilales bacterium]